MDERTRPSGSPDEPGPDAHHREDTVGRPAASDAGAAGDVGGQALSDAALARFMTEATAEFAAAAAAGDVARPGAVAVSGLPEPADAAAAVVHGFRPGPGPAAARGGERPWRPEDLAVFLQVCPRTLAGVLAAGGLAHRSLFSADDVSDLLAAGLPQVVLDADLPHLLAYPAQRTLVQVADAAAALGVPEATVAELANRDATGLGPPMLVVARWGATARVDVTATRRMLDLDGGWLAYMLALEHPGQRLQACARLAGAALSPDRPVPPGIGDL